MRWRLYLGKGVKYGRLSRLGSVHDEYKAAFRALVAEYLELETGDGGDQNLR